MAKTIFSFQKKSKVNRNFSLNKKNKASGVVIFVANSMSSLEIKMPLNLCFDNLLIEIFLGVLKV